MTMRRVIGALDRMEDAFRAVKDAWNKIRDAEIDSADRRADQAHRERIHAEIRADIKVHMCSDIPDAIISGEIRHLSINY